MYRHIRFPHDGSELSATAATDCIVLAKQMGAALTALQVIRHCDLLAKAIVDHAREANCDLIVMASHARNPVDSLLHGSTTTGVLRHCKVPVLVLRPDRTFS